MKKSRVWLVVLFLAIAGAVGAGLWVWRTIEARRASGQLVLYGNVDIREVNLAFNASDRIDEMYVVEGDAVKKGQLVATLDSRRLEQQAQQAKSEVEAQKQVVARLVAGSRPQEIERARAQAKAAEAKAADAEKTYRRIADLAKQDLASPQDVDNARAAMDSAREELAAARETLDLAVAGPRKEDIDEAKATLEAKEAQLAYIERQLADTRLYAPADGVVRTRVLEPGDMASPSTPVYTIAITDPVWVRVYVPETELGKLWQGMKAHATTDSFPGVRYDGWVGYISPTAEFTPKTVQTPELRTSLVYQVRVYVNNPRNELRLGMPATVTVPLDQSRPAEGARSADLDGSLAPRSRTGRDGTGGGVGD